MLFSPSIPPPRFCCANSSPGRAVIILSCSGLLPISYLPERRSLFELIPRRPDRVYQHLPREGIGFVMLHALSFAGTDSA